MTSTFARTPRIAVVAYTEYVSDGRVRFEAEALAQAGYRVDAVTVVPEGGPSPQSVEGVRLHEVPLRIRRGGKARYLWQYAMFLLLSTVVLVRLRLGGRFDLVHVHTLPDFQVFSALPLKLAGAVVVLDMHESMPELLRARLHQSTHSLLFRIAVIAQKVSALAADKVVLASEGCRSVLKSRGVPGKRLAVVYNSDHAPMALPSAEVVRRALGLPASKLIVHAGGVNPERDLVTLIRAVSMLPFETGIHLVIAGKGTDTYVAELRTEARTHSLEGRVHFVGRVPLDQARALMALSEVGVVTMERNPNTEISWPIRVGYYLHLRKPLIVPDFDVLRALLGDCARYYTPGDAQNLFRSVSAALAEQGGDLDKRVECEQVRDRFEWDRMRNTLLGVYDELLAPHGRTIH